jgi:hypothetical protein
MANKYNWDSWDNLDDYRTDDTCPDINDVETPATTGGVSLLEQDLAERNRYRYGYYLPGSPEDLAKPRATPRIESINILHTIEMQVFIRGRSSHG